MQMSDRLTLLHCDTQTHSGLVQFGNASLASCAAVMSGKDDIIKEAIVFSSHFAKLESRGVQSSIADGKLIG
jgi:hypothetical protein